MDSTSVIRSVNIALQIFGIAVAVVMMSSFRRDLFIRPSQRLFFSKIATAAGCMICFVLYNLRGVELKDPLNVILLSLSHVGVYVVAYI